MPSGKEQEERSVKMEGFKNLLVWQRAYRFTLTIYKISKDFPKDELYGLTSRIRRASVSVAANIAEGYEREYRKQFIHFLAIAKGSLGEVEAYLSLVKDLHYINEETYQELNCQRQEVGRLLRGFINSIK